MATEQRHLYKAEIVIGNEGKKRIQRYFEKVKENPSLMGLRLRYILGDSDLNNITLDDFVDAFLKTKKPYLFAEATHQLRGNGTDWTREEVNLLGFIGGMQDVTVYASKGPCKNESDVYQEDERIEATLLITQGPLLNGCAADEIDVLDKEGNFSNEKYQLYFEQHLLPLLIRANEKAKGENRRAVVTLPTLGGGQFTAPKYKKDVSDHFKQAVQASILKHASRLDYIDGFVYDLYKGQPKASEDIQAKGKNFKWVEIASGEPNQPSVLVNPLVHGFKGNPKLYITVAGDHVSFWGNDMWKNQNATQEGGITSVTDLFSRILNWAGGLYKKITDEGTVADDRQYMPPKSPDAKEGEPHPHWDQIAEAKKVQYTLNNGVFSNGAYAYSPAYKPRYLSAIEWSTYLLSQTDQMPFLSEDEKETYAILKKLEVKYGINNDLRLGLLKSSAKARQNLLYLMETVSKEFGNFRSGVVDHFLQNLKLLENDELCALFGQIGKYALVHKADEQGKAIRQKLFESADAREALSYLLQRVPSDSTHQSKIVEEYLKNPEKLASSSNPTAEKESLKKDVLQIRENPQLCAILLELQRRFNPLEGELGDISQKLINKKEDLIVFESLLRNNKFKSFQEAKKYFSEDFFNKNDSVELSIKALCNLPLSPEVFDALYPSFLESKNALGNEKVVILVPVPDEIIKEYDLDLSSKVEGSQTFKNYPQGKALNDFISRLTVIGARGTSATADSNSLANDVELYFVHDTYEKIDADLGRLQDKDKIKGATHVGTLFPLKSTGRSYVENQCQFIKNNSDDPSYASASKTQQAILKTLGQIMSVVAESPAYKNQAILAEAIRDLSQQNKTFTHITALFKTAFESEETIKGTNYNPFRWALQKEKPPEEIHLLYKQVVNFEELYAKSQHTIKNFDDLVETQLKVDFIFFVDKEIKRLEAEGELASARLKADAYKALRATLMQSLAKPSESLDDVLKQSLNQCVVYDRVTRKPFLVAPDKVSGTYNYFQAKGIKKNKVTFSDMLQWNRTWGGIGGNVSSWTHYQKEVMKTEQARRKLKGLCPVLSGKILDKFPSARVSAYNSQFDPQVRKSCYKTFKENKKLQALTAQDQESGVRVYTDLEDKDFVVKTLSREQGYALPLAQRHLTKRRVVASKAHFIGNGSGDFHPDKPLGVTLITSCAPNLRHPENPEDFTQCVIKESGQNFQAAILDQENYKKEMQGVWSRYFFAAEYEAQREGKNAHVVTPLLGAGAYLEGLSEDQKEIARKIIIETMIEVFNEKDQQTGESLFSHLKTLHLAVPYGEKDESLYALAKEVMSRKDYQDSEKYSKPIVLSAGDLLKLSQAIQEDYPQESVTLFNPGSDHVIGGGVYKDRGESKRDGGHDYKTGGIGKGVDRPGEYNPETKALEEQLGHYGNFVYVQNLGQNPNGDKIEFLDFNNKKIELSKDIKEKLGVKTSEGQGENTTDDPHLGRG